MAKTPKDRRGSNLADRLRFNMTKKARALEAEKALKAQQRETALRERVTLLGDLKAFGETVGFEVRDSKQHVVFQLGDQQIDFDASDEEGHVLILEAAESPKRFALQFEHRLGKWVLRIRREKASDEQLLLFDTGLEYLIEAVFDLEAANESEMLEAERARQKSSDETPKRSL